LDETVLTTPPGLSVTGASAHRRSTGTPHRQFPRTGPTYPAARTAIKRLVELVIVAEVTGKSYGRTYTASAVETRHYVRRQGPEPRTS
jgi:hypothetical protein